MALKHMSLQNAMPTRDGNNKRHYLLTSAVILITILVGLIHPITAIVAAIILAAFGVGIHRQTEDKTIRSLAHIAILAAVLVVIVGLVPIIFAPVPGEISYTVATPTP